MDRKRQNKNLSTQDKARLEISIPREIMKFAKVLYTNHLYTDLFPSNSRFVTINHPAIHLEIAKRLHDFFQEKSFVGFDEDDRTVDCSLGVISHEMNFLLHFETCALRDYDDDGLTDTMTNWARKDLWKLTVGLIFQENLFVVTVNDNGDQLLPRVLINLCLEYLNDPSDEAHTKNFQEEQRTKIPFLIKHPKE